MKSIHTHTHARTHAHARARTLPVEDAQTELLTVSLRKS
jgi:hypothetical protein